MHWNIATNNSSVKICRNETSNSIFLVPAQWGLALKEFRWANSPDSYENSGHSWWHCPKKSGPSNPSRFFRPVACFCSPWPGQSQGRFCSPHLLKVKHNQTKVSVWNCYHCILSAKPNGEAEHAFVFKSHHLSHDPLPVHLTFARVSVAIGLVFLEDPVRIKCHRSWWRDGKAVMVQKCPSIHRVLPVLHTTWQFLALEIVGKEFISLITHGKKGEFINVIQYTSTPYTSAPCLSMLSKFVTVDSRQFPPPVTSHPSACQWRHPSACHCRSGRVHFCSAYHSCSRMMVVKWYKSSQIMTPNWDSYLIYQLHPTIASVKYGKWHPLKIPP